MLRFLLVPALATSLIFGGFAAPTAATSPAVKRSESDELAQFATLIVLSQSPESTKAAEIDFVYRALPRLVWQSEARQGPLLPDDRPDLTLDQKELAPNKQIELARKSGNSHYADIEGARLARQILRAHSDEVAALVHDDLRADDEARQTRGLRVLMLLSPDIPSIASALPAQQSFLSARWHDVIYQDVAEIFRSQPEEINASRLFIQNLVSYHNSLKTQAQQALIFLQDPRAIALLINDEPSQPTLHAWTIWFLARRAPDNPALLPLINLLDSPAPRERAAALSALPASAFAVRATLPRLLDDADERVRQAAIDKSFQLEGAQFAELESRIVAKLADANRGVRLAAAANFARRKNPIAAPVLLAALRDDASQIETGYYSDLLNQSIGFDSGYDAKSPSADPVRKQHNAAILARIEAWIAAHPAR